MKVVGAICMDAGCRVVGVICMVVGGLEVNAICMDASMKQAVVHVRKINHLIKINHLMVEIIIITELT